MLGPIHTFWRISNGHNSAMHQLIPSMFGSRVGFSRSADQMALFPVNWQWHRLSCGMFSPKSITPVSP